MTTPSARFAPPALSRGSIDRAAHRRPDQGWLDAAWRDERARAFGVHDGRFPVTELDGEPRLALTSTGEQSQEAARYFLGEGQDGAPYFAVGALEQSTRTATLREVGALLPDDDAGLAVHAVALDNWHATHTHCPRCGGATFPAAGGHVRRCENDGSQHFPRTDPAVIMLVHDGGDRCLLGRQPSWQRFSTLAGFVEPGESLEQAVVREVAEEVGVPVTDVEYVASQPWPFPSSLMLGFRARATAYDVALVDGEIAEARWFSRDDLRAARADGSIALSSPVSIAYRLMSDWADEQ